MKKRDGYTLLEILIAIAMLAIFASLLMPLGRAFTISHNKMSEVNDLDLELAKTIDVIKRAIRAAQEDDESPADSAVLEPASSAIATSSALTLTLRESENATADFQYVRFYYDVNNRELRVASSTNTDDASNPSNITGSSVLMQNVEAVEFRYNDNIITMYFQLAKRDEDGNILYTREVRDAGVTRIDFQISRKVTFGS